jgi:signal transduction histidine kinase
MRLNFKHSLTYLPYCLVPLLLLAALNYWNGLKTVDATLSTQAQNHLNSLAGEIDRRLRDEEVELSRAALSSQLRDLINTKKNSTPASLTSTGPNLSPELFQSLSSTLRGRGHWIRLTAFDESLRPLFRIERIHTAQGPDTFRSSPLDRVAPPSANSLVKKDSAVELSGSTLRCSVPIAIGSSEPAGTLIGELNLEELISESTAIVTSTQGTSDSQRAFVIAIDPSAKIIQHSNSGVEGKMVSSALPEFLPIAEKLTRGVSGLERLQSSTGAEFITAFSPLPKWNTGLAVGYDRAPSAAVAHRWGIIGFVIALVGAFGAALLISAQAQKKSQGLERVEEGLSAIAKGELDRRIELGSSDDARVIADNINVMTERLRAQIAREEETKQFQSFVRLSAMLIHDLKNAIEALSLIVGNMGRHFDNEQFRVDALRSLTSATEKLKGIVSKLSRPLSSLSGEHPKPKSLDLVVVIRQVAKLTAEPLREKHTIEMKLPDHLFVYADPERIEKVIENLILNALEAMAHQNGKLTIEAGLTSRGAATFSVSDTGPGMSRSFINHQLFRPFSTTKKHGVGLGLYTCREVIEASAGSIEVESTEGAGTTFRVVLPSASHDSRS